MNPLEWSSRERTPKGVTRRSLPALSSVSLAWAEPRDTPRNLVVVPIRERALPEDNWTRTTRSPGRNVETPLIGVFISSFLFLSPSLRMWTVHRRIIFPTEFTLWPKQDTVDSPILVFTSGLRFFQSKVEWKSLLVDEVLPIIHWLHHSRTVISLSVSPILETLLYRLTTFVPYLGSDTMI